MSKHFQVFHGMIVNIGVELNQMIQGFEGGTQLVQQLATVGQCLRLEQWDLII
jgi:hypothetical protein